MATDVAQSNYGWSHDEFPDRDDTEDASTAQMLDHGSISFGRFAVEPLAWEKRSVFKHNRCQEELEIFKAPGLVAQKKAYFEEYYKNVRALKALQQSQQNEPTQQTELNLDRGNAIFSSETGEEVETSIQPQSFGGVSSALSGEEPNELGSLQTDYGSALLIIPSDQRSIHSLPRSMEFDELEKDGDSAGDTEHALLVRTGEENQNEINDVENKALAIQETALCDVGCEMFVKEIETEAESSKVGNNGSSACSVMDDKPKLIMEKSRDACSKLEVIAPVRTNSKLDPKRRPVLLKSSEGSRPHAKSVGKAGSSIVLNKTSNSLTSNRRPASSYSQRNSTVSNKPSANRLPIDKRPASSCSRRPMPHLVGKDNKLSSKAGNRTVLNNPAANRLQINMIRPSTASSQRLTLKSVDKDEKISGRTGNNTILDKPTVNNSQTFKRPASASSQRLQLVSRNKNLSEKGVRSVVANKPSAGYSWPASAASHRSLTEERSRTTVPRPFSFAADRRPAISSARVTATQISSRAPRPSHSPVLGESGLKVQAGSKKTAIKGMERRKANENRDGQEVRKETSVVVKHDGNRGRSAGVNHVIGTQTARSFNLPARRMPYPTVAMRKGFGNEENHDKVVIEPKVFESTSSTSGPDDKKRIPPRSREPSVGARRPPTADSSHCRTSRKELPRWR